MAAMQAVAPALRTELSAFERALPQLLPQHEGEWVVMRGAEILHWASTYQLALEWGYRTFGLDQQFFVKKVSAEQNTVHFTRDLPTCTK